MNNISGFWIVVMIASMLAWTLAAYPVIGLIALVLYVIFVFWRSQPSDQVFQLAMFTLGATLLATLLQNPAATNAFSGYTLLLFIVGATVLAKELWRHSLVLKSSQRKGGSAYAGLRKPL